MKKSKTAMELPILAVLLSSFILSVGSHPKNSDVIPKDYYKRQILQPIPGYIPVYIKPEEVPLVRTQIKKESSSIVPEKVKEKHIQLQDEELLEIQKKNSGETKNGREATETKYQGNNAPEKTETAVDLQKNQKEVENSKVNVDDPKS